MLIKDLSIKDLENIKNLLKLRFTKGIGSKVIKKILLDKIIFEGKSLFNSPIDSAHTSSVSDDDISSCISNYINKNVGILLYGRFEYPSILGHIDDPPPILFYRGDTNCLKTDNSIAVIGTRKPRVISLNRVKEFIAELSKYDISIISGLAFGVDKQAHLSAIQHGMQTIAVLASSVDKCTPTANSFVYEKILNNNGLILSENTNLDIIGPYSFAKRNRLIAGLSKNVLFIEGNIDSGALITCNLAFDYNRNVFALPAEPKTMSGGNLLIRQDKARLVEDPSQLIEDLGLIQNKLNLTKIDKTLSQEEQLILSLIDRNGSNIDEIFIKAGLDLNKIMMILFTLECKNLIFKNSGLYFLI